MTRNAPADPGVGEAYDNAMAESFFASLECELIDRRVWKTFAQARMEIFTWIEGWYNPRRRRSDLGQRSPVNFEREQADRVTRGRRACEDGLPNGCFAPVNKPPQGAMKGPSPCPQVGPLDNPAPEHARTPFALNRSSHERRFRMRTASTAPGPSANGRVMSSWSTTTSPITMRCSSGACRFGSAKRAALRSRMAVWPRANSSPCSAYCAASAA